MFLYRMKVAKAVSCVRRIMDERQEAQQSGWPFEVGQAGLHLWALSELVIVLAEALVVTMSRVEDLRREQEKGR